MLIMLLLPSFLSQRASTGKDMSTHTRAHTGTDTDTDTHTILVSAGQKGAVLCLAVSGAQATPSTNPRTVWNQPKHTLHTRRIWTEPSANTNT